MWTWWRHKTKPEEANGHPAPPAIDTQGEGSEDCPKCLERSSAIESNLSAYRAKIGGRIQDTQDITDKEILAIGDCVNNIVTHTRQYIEESSEVLEKNFAEQSSSLENYLNYSKENIKTQSNTVEQALTLSEDISAAGVAVDKLASEAKLLALNATIEAARLGSSGSAFGVISEEMNHLSDKIANANRLISNSTEGIKTCLPTIMKQTTVQIEKLESFMSTMQQLKEGVEQSTSTTNNVGDTHLDMILNLANSALSHLQFQDPMLQKLRKIDSLMKELHDKLNLSMDLPLADGVIPGNISEIEHQDASQEADVDPGDVMLF